MPEDVVLQLVDGTITERELTERQKHRVLTSSRLCPTN